MKMVERLSDRRHNGRAMMHLINVLRVMRRGDEASAEQREKRLNSFRQRAATGQPLFDDASA